MLSALQSRARSAVASSFRLGVGIHSNVHRNASSLVICQHKNGEYDPSLLNTITAAKALGGEVSVLVAGKDVDAIAKKVSSIEGVSKVLTFSSDKFSTPVAENVTKLVSKVFSSNKFTHILAAATSEAKNTLPRVAAALNGAAISEIISVDSEHTFKRPMYAGNAIASVKCTHEPKVITIRATNFDKAKIAASTAKIEKISASESEVVFSGVEFVEEKVAKSDRPEITAANVVVSGGRALKSAENFKILDAFADAKAFKNKGGAAVGASRAAVDAGYAPNDMQIGQTGKVCAPSLYFAVGISGAIQHLAGMKDSKCIVAINTDPDAPIFQVSDYGLKEDLFKAVPELTEKLNA